MRAGLRAMLSDGAFRVLDESASLAALVLPADLDVMILTTLDDLPTATVAVGLPAVVLISDAPQAIADLSRSTLPGWAVLSELASADTLRAAVAAAAAGLAVMPPNALLAGPRPVSADGPLDEPLTPREQQVLELLSQGLSNKMIARELRISEHTVKFHVSSTYAKLDAANRTEAVSRAARRGLISL